MIREDDVVAHPTRGLDARRARSLRGTAQNPDVFFQAREACNPFYDAVPGIVAARSWTSSPQRTGRRYRLVDYDGAPDAERVVVLMGSGAGAVEETVETLIAARREGRPAQGPPVPAVPRRRAGRRAAADASRSIAVLDRTKEPGAVGEPLYLDVRRRAGRGDGQRRAAVRGLPRVIGGRYGLSSQGVHARRWLKRGLRRAGRRAAEAPLHRRHRRRRHPPQPAESTRRFTHRPAGEVQAVFFGLGCDGTVGANKNSVKIIGENTDALRAGLLRLRLEEVGLGHRLAPALRPASRSARRTSSTSADFVACHQFGLLETHRRCSTSREPGATFLLNSPYGPDEVWDQLPARGAAADHRQEARASGSSTPTASPSEAGMGGRINTVMQPCFFALVGRAARRTRRSPRSRTSIETDLRQARPRRRRAQLRRHRPRARRARARSRCPPRSTGDRTRRHRPSPTTRPTSSSGSPRCCSPARATCCPVSALPVDGTFPTGTARYEKRAIATEIPIWDPRHLHRLRQVRDRLPARRDPHEGLRARRRWPARPTASCRKPFRSKDLAGSPPDHPGRPRRLHRLRRVRRRLPGQEQDRGRSHKAINMEPALDAPRRRSGASWDFFLDDPRARPRACCRTTRSRARRCSSRCSSSPAPAPAAARRPT